MPINAQIQEVINYMKQGGAPVMMSILGKPQDAQVKKALSQIPKNTAEGTFNFTCLYASFEKSTFNDNTTNFVLYLYNESKQEGDFWRGSLSQEMAVSNIEGVEPKPHIMKTVDQLKKIINIGNVVKWADIVSQLINKVFPAWVAKKTSKNGKEYLAIASLGEGNFELPPPVALPADFDLGNMLNPAPQMPNFNNVPTFPPLPSAIPQQQAQPPAQNSGVNQFLNLQ